MDARSLRTRCYATRRMTPFREGPESPSIASEFRVANHASSRVLYDLLSDRASISTMGAGGHWVTDPGGNPPTPV